MVEQPSFVAWSCMVHVVEQLEHGNGCTLAVCALLLALGICGFTIGVVALAQNHIVFGDVLKEERPVEGP